jgi:adenosylcobyric acid synthase
LTGIVVCGTGSDSGKSTVVAGLCRLLARRGLKVAPFKAQNMALNSAVTAGGHEIGRAQYAQAQAAGVEPEAAMNPVLLKPTGERTSQVVVAGRPWRTLDAAAYHRAKPELWPVVAAAVDDLRDRFDVVVCEGAGSPAEINLLDSDITNLAVAAHAGFPALLVGDIDRGGVFASLYGTVSVLPPELSGLIRAFVINKFRGDPGLLRPGLAELERRTGRPNLGVIPWVEGAGLDAEDSLGLDRWPRRPPPGGDALDVTVARLPRISNFTDLDALRAEPAVSVRLVGHPVEVGSPDVFVLPGTKATVADLEWLRRSGLAAEVSRLAAAGTTVLGICGGYQMLGRTLCDGVEHPDPTPVEGLGLLPVSTRFAPEKVLARVSGTALGEQVAGYEIHHGRTPPVDPWLDLERGPEGSRRGTVFGTSVHGLFESDRFRRRFLAGVAAEAGRSWSAGPPVCFAAARQARFDRLADILEAHLDVGAVLRLMGMAP